MEAVTIITLHYYHFLPELALATAETGRVFLLLIIDLLRYNVPTDSISS
jgi:hypothetical protein